MGTFPRKLIKSSSYKVITLPVYEKEAPVIFFVAKTCVIAVDEAEVITLPVYEKETSVMFFVAKTCVITVDEAEGKIYRRRGRSHVEN